MPRRPVFFVILGFPFAIFRLAAVFDVRRHSLLAFNRSLGRIVDAQVIFVFTLEDALKIFRPIYEVIEVLRFDLFSLCAVLPAAKGGTFETAIKLHALCA